MSAEARAHPFESISEGASLIFEKQAPTDPAKVAALVADRIEDSATPGAAEDYRI